MKYYLYFKIHQFSRVRVAGAYPSCFRARGRVPPVQVAASLSQGKHIETENHSHSQSHRAPMTLLLSFYLKTICKIVLFIAAFSRCGRNVTVQFKCISRFLLWFFFKSRLFKYKLGFSVKKKSQEKYSIYKELSDKRHVSEEGSPRFLWLIVQMQVQNIVRTILKLRTQADFVLKWTDCSAIFVNYP